MDDKCRPSLEEFVASFGPAAERIARDILTRYKGWFQCPAEELKDLKSLAIHELCLKVHPTVDFTRKEGEVRKYVNMRIEGILMNYIDQYLKKNFPSFDCITETQENDPTVENHPEHSSGGRQFFRKLRISPETAADSRAKPKPRFSPQIPIEEIEPFLGRVDPGYEAVELALFRSRVLEAISVFLDDKCGAEDRFMFISRFVDKKSFLEIAAVTGRNRDTVSDRVMKKLIPTLKCFLAIHFGWNLKTGDVKEYLDEADLELMIVEF